MNPLREARFRWGQRVRAGISLLNDGSYPDCAPDAVLVAGGEWGEIVQVGHHVEANLPVYLVEFAIPGQPVRVVGCLEEELLAE